MAKTSNLTQRDVHPGYLGMSRGDDTINAIIYGADGAFYFYPVTSDQANAIEDWSLEGDEDDLRDALPDASEFDLDMFYAGKEIVD